MVIRSNRSCFIPVRNSKQNKTHMRAKQRKKRTDTETRTCMCRWNFCIAQKSDIRRIASAFVPFLTHFVSLFVFLFADPAAPPPPLDHFRLPPSAPIHLVCSVDSPTSILLTWQRLMSSERVAYYTVKYYPRGVLSPVPVVRKVYSESIIMSGLTPGKRICNLCSISS